MTHLDQHDLVCLEPFTVMYPSSGTSLRGYLLQPEGPGPFPAVLFEHGSSGLLPSHLPGVKALQGMGYAVFVALRRGHHGNAGPNWLSLVTAPWGSQEMGKQLTEALSDETEDVVSALAWLQARPEIDAGRIAIVGHSFGAVVSLLASVRTHQLRAGISFAGPSQSWSEAPALQEAMLAATEHLTIPFFLIQAQNDHSLLPTYMLGMQLARMNKIHETRIYPPLGTTAMEGHGLFGRGVEWWHTDVARFLAHWLY